MFKAWFKTIQRSANPSVAKLLQAEDQKAEFGQNTKWPLGIWVGLNFFGSENKIFPFYWAFGGVKELGSVRPKMAELQPFIFIFGTLAHVWKGDCVILGNFLKLVKRHPLLYNDFLGALTQPITSHSSYENFFAPLRCLIGPRIFKTKEGGGAESSVICQPLCIQWVIRLRCSV